MDTVKKQVLSKCCGAVVHYVPPSLGDPGILFCSSCSNECETEVKEVVTHKEIRKGILRPVNNGK